jgi:hypothetical protein
MVKRKEAVCWHAAGAQYAGARVWRIVIEIEIITSKAAEHDFLFQYLYTCSLHASAKAARPFWSLQLILCRACFSIAILHCSLEIFVYLTWQQYVCAKVK